jgi:acyl-CoA reductase-like NAD-dependent aldehyde dehydrogenase
MLTAIGSFIHAGQICMGTKRIYVHESVFVAFMEKFTAIVRSYQPGVGFLSPIQNKMQYDKAKSIFQDSQKRGHDFVLGDGKTFAEEKREGYFMAPAVIANPPEDSRVVQEEAFGPIIPVMSWRDDEEVVARTNDTPTGLGATVYCLNEKRAWKIASSLEVGSVWVNGGVKMHPEALFGAHKQSGIGGELGPLGLLYYTNTRTVTYWKESKANGTAGDKADESGLFA